MGVLPITLENLKHSNKGSVGMELRITVTKQENHSFSIEIYGRFVYNIVMRDFANLIRKETTTMKKFVAFLLAAMMLLGCTSALADPVTLVYSEVNPLEGTIVGSIAKFFKAKVEELSGGEIIIDIQGSGVLGTEAQILDGIMMDAGTVDISRISAFALTSYGCDKAKLLSIPYTFVGREHFWNFANSELAAEFLNEPQTIGLPLRGICYGEEGFRHFFVKTGVEVKGLEDLKGMKIRVSEDPVMTGMV